MEHVRRLNQLWSWLPAFRAVAETEHLHGAAALLHLTPSTLSRAIHLLEEQLGRSLFFRSGRNIALTPEGRRFLGFVRTAMRLLDDGADEVTGTQLAGPVKISTPGELTLAFIAPALERLTVAHPQLVPHVHSDPAWDVGPELLRGNIDVAFSFAAAPHASLTVERIGTVSSGIYCGAAHPLFAAAEVDLESLRPYPFVVAIDARHGQPADQWPPEIERRVATYVNEVAHAFEICARGKLLAAIPDFLPEVLCSAANMRRLPVDLGRLLPARSLYAVRRRALHEGGREAAVISEVRAEIASLAPTP